MTYFGIALIYYSIGLLIASYSGTHLVFFTFLWPWALAAQIVEWITGKYPRWTPDL
jgi:hypothetical protein